MAHTELSKELVRLQSKLVQLQAEEDQWKSDSAKLYDAQQERKQIEDQLFEKRKLLLELYKTLKQNRSSKQERIRERTRRKALLQAFVLARPARELLEQRGILARDVEHVEKVVDRLRRVGDRAAKEEDKLQTNLLAEELSRECGAIGYLESQEFSSSTRFILDEDELSRLSLDVYDCDDVVLDTAEGKLGEGCFAEVYKATIRPSGKHVAAKVLKGNEPLFVQAFTREVLALAKTRDSPNVVNLLGVCLEPKRMILLEYVDGSSLYQHIHGNHARLSPSVAVSIASNIAEGMRVLHSQKPAPLLHRDLTSRNCLLHRDHRCTVADLGLCVELKAKVGFRSYPNGAPRWRPPEACREEAVYTKKSDVWMFGVVMFELATGRLPFEGMEDQEVPKMVGKGALPEVPKGIVLSGAHKKLLALHKKCCSPTPRLRPSFKTLARKLKKLLGAVGQEE